MFFQRQKLLSVAALATPPSRPAGSGRTWCRQIQQDGMASSGILKLSGRYSKKLHALRNAVVCKFSIKIKLRQSTQQSTASLSCSVPQCPRAVPIPWVVLGGA